MRKGCPGFQDGVHGEFHAGYATCVFECGQIAVGNILPPVHRTVLIARKSHLGDRAGVPFLGEIVLHEGYVRFVEPMPLQSIAFVAELVDKLPSGIQITVPGIGDCDFPGDARYASFVTDGTVVS